MILPAKDHPGTAVMSVGFMHRVFQEVNDFVGSLWKIRDAAKGTRGMVAFELPRDHLEGGGLENGIGIQEEQQMAAGPRGAEVSGWTEAAFFQFEKLIAFTTDGVGGVVSTAVGDHDRFEIAVGLLFKRVQSRREQF